MIDTVGCPFAPTFDCQILAIAGMGAERYEVWTSQTSGLCVQATPLFLSPWFRGFTRPGGIYGGPL